MADLTFIEKKHLENLLRMGSGYVLDFSNSTLCEFVLESTGKNIYDEPYNHATGSKANRLRAFFALESNALVGKLIEDLVEYRRAFCAEAGDEKLCEEGLRIARRLRQEPLARRANAASSSSSETPPAAPDAHLHPTGCEPLTDDLRLSWHAIAEICEATVSLGLGRAALLVGINSALVARLDIAANPKEQLLLDLHALNRAGRLTDGTDPLEVWLRNAEMLSTPLQESRVFARHLKQLPLLTSVQPTSSGSLLLGNAARLIRQLAATRGVEIGDIQRAPTSPFGTESYRARVKDGQGVIYCHATGYRSGHAFYARKGIGWLYEYVLGGSSSQLGLPTSNEELVEQTRGPASFFEGGRISWSPKTSIARAVLTQEDGSEIVLAERRL
jgi:hypothetical protein